MRKDFLRLRRLISQFITEAYTVDYVLNDDGSLKKASLVQDAEDVIGLGSTLGYSSTRGGGDSVHAGYGIKIYNRPYETSLTIEGPGPPLPPGARRTGDSSNQRITIPVYSAFQGGWYTGYELDSNKQPRSQEDIDKDTIRNRHAYEDEMGKIKILSRYFKEIKDPAFLGMLTDAANMLYGYLGEADYIVVPDSSSDLGHQFAEKLADKFHAEGVVNKKQAILIAQKNADTLDVDRDFIEARASRTGNYKNRVDLATRSIQGMRAKAQARDAEDLRNDRDRAKHKLKAATAKYRTPLAPPRGTPFHAAGTGGQGGRLYIKGGFDIYDLPGGSAEGKKFLLVDDNVSEAWTFREVARRIIELGGTVVGCATLWKWGTEKNKNEDRAQTPLPQGGRPVANNPITFTSDADMERQVDDLVEQLNELPSVVRTKTLQFPTFMKELQDINPSIDQLDQFMSLVEDKIKENGWRKAGSSSEWSLNNISSILKTSNR